MSAQKNSQAAPKVKKRPQLYNTLPTEILPKNTFGIIEDENSEVFERIKAEKENRLNLDPHARRVDKKSALEVIDILKQEVENLKQDIKDLKELGNFHAREAHRLKEENDMLLETVSEVDGLDYIEAQERLIALKQEIIIKTDSLHQGYLEAQTLYNRHLTKLRRQIAKTSYAKEKGPTKPQKRDPLKQHDL